MFEVGELTNQPEMGGLFCVWEGVNALIGGAREDDKGKNCKRGLKWSGTAGKGRWKNEVGMNEKGESQGQREVMAKSGDSMGRPKRPMIL